MSEDLNEIAEECRLNDIEAVLKMTQAVFEEAVQCCVKSVDGMHKRVARLEEWMARKEKIKL